MSTVLLMINLIALAIVWAAAMFYYLRHGAPACAGQHYSQIALVLIAVGAFAAAVADLRAHQLSTWVVLFRVGLAMVAARYLARSWRTYRAERSL